MMIRTIALSSAFLIYGAPSLAQDVESFNANREAHTIRQFSLNGHRIDLSAATRNMRADTPASRRFNKDCRTMAKILPGYPQPALVSFNLSINF